MKPWRPRTWGEKGRADAAARRRRDLIDRLVSAWADGDETAIALLLSPDATILIDGGGLVPLGRTTAFGPPAVAATLVRALDGCPGVSLSRRAVNGETGIVAETTGRVVGVITARGDGTRIDRLWAVVNPEKLARWNDA